MTQGNSPAAGLEEPIKSSLEIYGRPLRGLAGLEPADLRFPESGDKRPISDKVLFKAIGRLPDVLRDHYISDSSDPGLAYYRYEVSPSSVLPGEQGFNIARYRTLKVNEQDTGRSFVISEIQLSDIPRGSPLFLRDLWDTAFLPSEYFSMMKKAGMPVDRDIEPLVGKFSDKETLIRQKRELLPFVILGELVILHEVGGILWIDLLSTGLKDRWQQLYPFKNNPEEGPIYLRNRISASAHASYGKNPEEGFYEDTFSDKFALYLLAQTYPALAEVGWVLRPEERAYFNDVIAYFEDKVARGFKVHEIEPPTSAGLEEGSKRAWPLFNTGAIGLVTGGLIGSAAMVMAEDPDPQQAQMVLLLSMALGTSAAYAIRAWWFRPRITRGVDRLLWEAEKNQPGLRNRFLALREAIRPRVLPGGKENRLAQRTLLPQLVDWITYWIQQYEIAPLLGVTSLVVLKAEKASSGESKAFHAPVLKGGGNLIAVSQSSQHKRYVKEVRTKLKQILQQIQFFLESKDQISRLLKESAALVREQEQLDPGWAPLDSFKQKQAQLERRLSELDQVLEDLKHVRRAMEISLEQVSRSRGRGKWEEMALSTEAFHLVESWVQISLGMPAVSAEEFSEQSGPERLDPRRLIRVQSEAGDHLSNIITGAWNPKYVPLLAKELDKRDEHPPTNNHALATLISATAFQKVDQWVAEGSSPAAFRSRLLWRMIQLNSLTNVTLEYGAEQGVAEGIYQKVMKILSAPDVLTQFWMEDRAQVMPLARFARSIQDFRRPADLYDQLRARIQALQWKLPKETNDAVPANAAVLEGWIASLDQEQHDLPAAGLEEGFKALEEAVPHGLTPVLVGAGLEERYPKLIRKLQALAGVPGSPFVLSSGDPVEDVAGLVARGAGSVLFVGLEEQAARLKPLADLAGLESRAIVPGQWEFVPFILAVLAESAGLEESALAAKRWFGDLLDAVETLAPAA